jgi:hypothetical protein
LPSDEGSDLTKENTMKHFIKTYAWPVLVIGLAFMAGEALSHLSAALPAGLYLGTVFYAPANTGEALSTMAPDAVRKLWQSGVDVFEQSEDFFAPMEGGAQRLHRDGNGHEQGPRHDDPVRR